MKNQAQSQRQNQVVDQNYANNTLYMALSIFETLQHRIEGKRRKKEFGAYDVYDYWEKSFPELLSQAMTNIMLICASRQCFNSEYGQGSYKLPKSYDE